MRRLKRYLWSSSRTNTNGGDDGSNGNSDKNNRHTTNPLFAVQRRTISHTSSSSSIKQHENITSCTDATVGSKARMFLNLPLLRNGLWMRKICPLVSAAERRLRGLLQLQGVKRHEGRVDTIVGEERKKMAAGFLDSEAETDHAYGDFNLQAMDDYDSVLSYACKAVHQNDNCSYDDRGGSQTKTILAALLVGCMLLTSVTTFVLEGTKALFLVRPLRRGHPTRRRTKIMMIMSAKGVSDDHPDVPTDVTTSLRTILLFLTRGLLFSAFVACLYTLVLQIAQSQRSIVTVHVCDEGSDKDTGFFNRTNCGEHHGKRTDGVNCTDSTSGCWSSSIILLKLGILVAFAAFVGGVVGPSSTPPRKHVVKKDEPLREEGCEGYDYDKKESQQDYHCWSPPREKLLTLLPFPPPRPLPSPADYSSSHKHALPPPSRGGSTCSCVTSHHCCTSHFLTPRRDLAHTTNGNASCHTHATTNLSSWWHRCCSTAKEVVDATATLFLLFMCPFYSSKREYCCRNSSLLGQKKKCARSCGADEHQQKEPPHLYPPLLRLSGAVHSSKVCGVVGSTPWPSASSFSSHAAPCSLLSPLSSRWRPSSSNYSSCNYLRLSVHTVALFCLLNVDNCQYKHLHDLMQNSSSEMERAVVGGASEYSAPSQTAGVKGASELMSSSWSISSLLSSSFLHSYYTTAAATPSLVAYVGLLAPVFWITLCFYTRQTGW